MADIEPKKRRGRPAKPLGDEARGPLTIRLRSEVRREVAQAAVKYGRSLSEEIESRLEVSLAFKQYIKHEWGDDWFQIAQSAAASLSHIEAVQEKQWIDDEATANLFALTLQQLVRNYRDHVIRAKGRTTPVGNFDGKSPEEAAQMFAALGGLPPPRAKTKPKRSLVIDEEELS